MSRKRSKKQQRRKQKQKRKESGPERKLQKRKEAPQRPNFDPRVDAALSFELRSRYDHHFPAHSKSEVDEEIIDRIDRLRDTHPKAHNGMSELARLETNWRSKTLPPNEVLLILKQLRLMLRSAPDLIGPLDYESCLKRASELDRIDAEIGALRATDADIGALRAEVSKARPRLTSRLRKIVKEGKAQQKDMVKRLPYMKSYERAVQRNGVGLTMDSTIRSLLGMVNRGRLWRWGITQDGGPPVLGDSHVLVGKTRTAPSLYLASAFFLPPENDRRIWKLREEVNHCFSVEDYEEWTASSRYSSHPHKFWYELREQLQDGVTYHYNSAGSNILQNVIDRDVQVDGVSMVRDGDVLTVMLRHHPMSLDGQGPDLVIVRYDMRSWRTAAALMLESGRTFGFTHPTSAVDVFCAQNSHHAYEDLCAAAEKIEDEIEKCGDYWPVRSRNPQVSVPKSDWDLDEVDLSKIMSSSEGVFHAANGNVSVQAATDLLLLPLYFAFKVDVVSETACRTQINDSDEKDHKGPKFKKERVLLRLVKSINVKRIETPNGDYTPRNYVPPSHQVPTRGHRRKLRPDRWGKDKDGKPVLGWTWVKECVKHSDKPPAPTTRTVYVKEITEEARRLESSQSGQ